MKKIVILSLGMLFSQTAFSQQSTWLFPDHEWLEKIIVSPFTDFVPSSRNEVNVNPVPRENSKQNTFKEIAIDWTSCLDKAVRIALVPDDVVAMCKYFEPLGVAALQREGLSPAQSVLKMGELVNRARQFAADDLRKQKQKNPK